MPSPKFPFYREFEFLMKPVFLSLIGDSFSIAILTFILNISFAKIFSKKHKYKIYANQVSLVV